MTLRLVRGDVRDVSQACACGCGFQIPRDPEVRDVVNFGGPRPYPAYLREHSPDYGTYRGKPRACEDAGALPGFVPASDLPRPPTTPKPPVAPCPTIEVAHEESEATASPEAGRPWASGQLVFNAGSFESARSGFADYGAPSRTNTVRVRVLLWIEP